MRDEITRTANIEQRVSNLKQNTGLQIENNEYNLLEQYSTCHAKFDLFLISIIKLVYEFKFYKENYASIFHTEVIHRQLVNLNLVLLKY